MAKNIVKYHSIYLFIITLATIGFITGFTFYKIQNDTTKQNIKETINIKDNLSTGSNNIFKSTKESVKIFINSIFIISILINISNIFLKPFEIGFIFSFLTTYNFKLSLIYSLFYLIIPLLFFFILMRIGLTLAHNLLVLIFTRDKKLLKQLKLLCMKYLLITFFLILYEIIIAIFSTNINSYLMTFL